MIGFAQFHIPCPCPIPGESGERTGPVKGNRVAGNPKTTDAGVERPFETKRTSAHESTTGPVCPHSMGNIFPSNFKRQGTIWRLATSKNSPEFSSVGPEDKKCELSFQLPQHCLKSAEIRLILLLEQVKK